LADGIKIRALNQTTLIDDTDVLIIDKADAFGDSSLTYYITYADVKTDLFTGDITIDGSLTVNNDLSVGGSSSFSGTVNFDSTVRVNGTIEVENINVNNNANINLDQLLDVEVGGAQPDDYLMYNGTNWVVGQPSGGGGGEPTGGGELDYVMFKSAAEPVVFTVTVGPKTSINSTFGIGATECFYINGIESPTLIFGANREYIFDQSDVSNVGYPLVFYFQLNTSTFMTPYPVGTSYTGTSGIDGRSSIKFTNNDRGDGFIDEQTAPKIVYNVDKNTGLKHMGNTIMNAATMLDDSGVGRMTESIDNLETKLATLEAHVGNLLELE